MIVHFNNVPVSEWTDFFPFISSPARSHQAAESHTTIFFVCASPMNKLPWCIGSHWAWGTQFSRFTGFFQLHFFFLCGYLLEFNKFWFLSLPLSLSFCSAIQIPFAFQKFQVHLVLGGGFDDENLRMRMTSNRFSHSWRPWWL